jgi:hypothetical protein
MTLDLESKATTPCRSGGKGKPSTLWWVRVMLGPYAIVKRSPRLQHNLPAVAGSSPCGIPTHASKLRREYARSHRRSLIEVSPEFRVRGGSWDRTDSSRCGVKYDQDADDILAAAIAIGSGRLISAGQSRRGRWIHLLNYQEMESQQDMTTVDNHRRKPVRTTVVVFEGTNGQESAIGEPNKGRVETPKDWY